jgi:hypothetical protein
LTLAVVSNILRHRDIAGKNQSKGHSSNMTQKGSPYIDHTGTIIIPFDTDQKYHYWNGGQNLSETLMELKAPQDVWNKHTLKPYPGDAT